uniref:L-serine deaminase n=1 Tax=Mayetiola destructor TaxID=39758 RepID=A0A2U9K563_MAYDE|nr:threonine dehydratase [Mayetiola destructor]
MTETDDQTHANPNSLDMDNSYTEITDPNCVADKPYMVSFHDITSAWFLIKSGIEYTPCSRSRATRNGMELYLKKDLLQYTGSFKERGARYALLKLTAEEKKIGVISASLGNHAQGLSYHAFLLDIPCTVVMPKTAPIMKIQRCRSFNADVLVYGANMGEARRKALQISKDKKLTYINGYDHPNIIAGQGTIGLEICEQVQHPDAVVIPVGGGGLIAGVATAIKALSPKTKIIGVESEKCPSFSKALNHGKPVQVKIEPTLADGLAVPQVGYNAFATVVPLLDKMVVVKEEWIALAILRLVEQEKLVVEGAGAAGLAAILAGQLDEFKDKKVVLLLCGGNIDTTTFGRCLERGLASEGRLLRFNATLDDRPGGIAELCRCLADVGVTIKDIMHERAWLKDIYSVEVKVVCETRDWEHSKELRKVLLENYQFVVFNDLPLAHEGN